MSLGNDMLEKPAEPAGGFQHAALMRQFYSVVNVSGRKAAQASVGNVVQGFPE